MKRSRIREQYKGWLKKTNHNWTRDDSDFKHLNQKEGVDKFTCMDCKIRIHFGRKTLVIINDRIPTISIHKVQVGNYVSQFLPDCNAEILSTVMSL